MVNVNQLYDAVREYLESQNFRYTDHDDEFFFELVVNLKCKLKSCKTYIFCRERGVTCITTISLKADKDSEGQVVEYITRANYGLNIGKFEYDYSDGEVRYTSYLSTPDRIPSQREIENTVDVGFMMFNRYGDGLVKAIMGMGDPEKDVAAAEGK